MRDTYDVVVVGAGPSGSVAARKFAESGLRVLLIEKRQEIGAPVRCAEAISVTETEPYIPIDERWVNAHISHYTIHNLAGDSIKVPPASPTLIVNRKVFDWELAHLAAKAGAEVRTKTQAEALVKTGDRITGLKINSMGKYAVVNTRLIIAADGTESQIARWAGLKSVPPMGDYYVGFQYLLGNMRRWIVPTVCEYHLGNELFPGGYGWVFPKGDDTANVGLVITADRAKDTSAQGYLDRFIARYGPNVSILGAVAGGIPATGALKKMVTDGVMVVGDAAHQADPLTAGGINLGMIGADLAAQVAIKALNKGDVSARTLSEYERLWHSRFGRMHAALYQVRKLLSKLENERLAALIRTASTFDIEHMSLGELFLGVMKDQPRLLIEARTLVATGLLIK